MRAELDTINGEPVLRIDAGAAGNYGRRATFDLPITREQAQKIQIMKDTVV